MLWLSGASLLSGSLYAAPRPTQRLRLGIDNFAVRAMNWHARQLIDYAAGLQVDSLFITDLASLGSLREEDLVEVREYAAEKGVRLYVGTWSICPTSTTFRDDWGTAREHLELAIRVAHAVGSPVIRVVLGSWRDRLTEGGIDARIKDTVDVLRQAKPVAMESGVKVAVENHAGDLHSLELVRLVEEAGPDFVGVNLDSGNAVWTLEDPLLNLENLGRYTLTTSLRDAVVWPSENGFTAQWTAMGEGTVDWNVYFQRFGQLCPDAPVHIETISGFNHEMAVHGDEFWKAWPGGKPAGYEAFVKYAKRGQPRASWQPPEGVDRDEASRTYQRQELERSLKYCRRLGLGQNAS